MGLHQAPRCPRSFVSQLPPSFPQAPSPFIYILFPLCGMLVTHHGTEDTGLIINEGPPPQQFMTYVGNVRHPDLHLPLHHAVGAKLLRQRSHCMATGFKAGAGKGAGCTAETPGKTECACRESSQELKFAGCFVCVSAAMLNVQQTQAHVSLTIHLQGRRCDLCFTDEQRGALGSSSQVAHLNSDFMHFYFLKDGVPLHSQTDLKSAFLLPMPPEYWDYRPVPPCTPTNPFSRNLDSQ